LFELFDKKEDYMVISYSRGHRIYYDGSIWKYCDNNLPLNDYRPCKKCGMPPIKEGYDYCLGYIEGVTSACCGHGIESGLIIYNKTDILYE